MSFDTIPPPPPPPPDPPSPFVPFQLCVLFFLFSFIKSNLLCPYIHGCVAFQWSMVNLPGPTFLKKTDFASPRSYQLSMALWSGVGLHAHRLSPCWIWFGLSYMEHKSCEDITHEQLLLCFWRTLFKLVLTRKLHSSWLLTVLEAAKHAAGRSNSQSYSAMNSVVKTRLASHSQ